MSKLENKLAAGVRQAKQEQGEAKQEQPRQAQGNQDKGGKDEANKKPASKSSGGSSRGRDEADAQAPRTTLNDPWKDLYPQRVWPD